MELVFQTWLELGSRAILIVAQHPNSREQTNACVVLYFSPTKRTTVTGLTKTIIPYLSKNSSKIHGNVFTTDFRAMQSQE